jgi:hypothetical protein
MLARRTSRRATVVVVTALLLVVLLGMVAFAVDIGYILLVKNHLQVAADAAAHAGVNDLGKGNDAAVATAKAVAQANIAGGRNDWVVLQNQDVTVGRWDSSTKTFTPNSPASNAVKVVAVRDPLNLFFAPVLGVSSVRVEAQAIAMINPRDIAFVIDLSGSMNNDTEVWATASINGAFPGYPTIGSDLMVSLFQDFNFGTYPGTVKHIGEGSIPSSQLTTNAYNYLANTYLYNNLSVASQYRTLSGDNSATRKTKTYKWIIDYQLASIMPNAKPTPSSGTNLSYYTDYLDFVISGGSNPPPNQNSFQMSGAGNPYTDAWPNLTSASYSAYLNKVGYLTYVQFMMDYGWNKKAAGNTTYVPLSHLSTDCPLRFEGDTSSPGYGFSFPPREQPTHAVRLAIMAAVNRVAELNANTTDLQKDHVCVITFDTVSGTAVKYPLSASACDYNAVKGSVCNLQAVGDDQLSTATETGLSLAKSHLDPSQNSNARSFSTKVVIFLSDGIPNVKQSGNTTISNYAATHPGEWFTSGSYMYERNAALMQSSMMTGLGWKVYAVGVGLAADRDFMDRMARMAGTAKPDPNNPSGPKISPYAEGNPADYQQRLTNIFNEIITSRGGRIVQ